MLSGWADHWAIPAIVAPFVGSFLAAAVTRLPAGIGIVTGRSRCPSCGHALGAADLVPILSWLVSRAKCRYCGGRIDYLYPAMELTAVLIAIWAATVLSGWLLWAGCLLGWILLALGVMDRRHMVLADGLTIPLVAGGLVVAYLIGADTLRDAVIGAVAGFAVFALIGAIYRRLRGREGLGLGDAKLLAAAGAWLGWAGLPTVVAAAAVFALGAVLAKALVGRRIEATERLAFGPYLGAATWLVWLYGPFTVG